MIQTARCCVLFIRLFFRFGYYRYEFGLRVYKKNRLFRPPVDVGNGFLLFWGHNSQSPGDTANELFLAQRGVGYVLA